MLLKSIAFATARFSYTSNSREYIDVPYWRYCHRDASNLSSAWWRSEKNAKVARQIRLRSDEWRL